jgi:hypothetical protein
VRTFPSLALVLLSACGGGGGPAHDAGSCDTTSYPCGPYGFAQGSTIDNLSLSGKRDANQSGDVLDDPIGPIWLGDYHAQPGLRALLIVIGTETCVPCQNEQPQLLSLYRRYAASGALAVLEAIVEGQGGKPADTAVVDAWVSRFGVPFDMTADPTGALRPYYSSASYPWAFVLRVADMNLISVVNGPPDGIEATIEALAQ